MQFTLPHQPLQPHSKLRRLDRLDQSHFPFPQPPLEVPP